MKFLVIVESPAKAGTISKILGDNYAVTSSFGHVRDLAKDGKGNTGVEVENRYMPHYIVPPDKLKTVTDLKKKIQKFEKVILATDEDREGEAISWHLKEVLKLPDKKLQRITFTEITPEAIQKAIQSPRTIDMDLVNAQQARRILDRLVGFELTNLLWKKVRGQLSAGRVQSVAVRLVAEREREIHAFKPSIYYKVTAHFSGHNTQSFPAQLSEDLSSQESAQSFLEKCKKATFSVDSVDVKPAKKSPSPPFTTSTLQQLASHKLGFSVSRTMSAAQRLYEAGHITYMRTDSMTLSQGALKSIASYITSSFGEKYLQTRQYKTKSKSSQEAHEAIRPTYIQKDHVSSKGDEQKLYSLIRSRALASQMAPAEVLKTEIRIPISTIRDKHFVAKGEVITFDGFLRAYKGTKYMAQDDIILPKLEQGESLTCKDIQALERKTKPPARYSEATLVKKLEELGIGRPSTYAPTIAKITSPTRGYISKETREGEPIDYVLLTLTKGKITHTVQSEITGAQKNKLFASDMGLIVTDFLFEHFRTIMEYAFTAEVEDKLDDIAIGKADWKKIIDYYYRPFSKNVDTTLEEADRVTGERVLGKDKKSGRTILVRMSRFGPVAQIGTPEEVGKKEKPHYASLLPSQSLESVTLHEVQQLFELPKVLGTYKGTDIIVARGRYGPFIKYNEIYISLPKGVNPFSLTVEESKDLIREKLEALKPIGYYNKLPITKGVGRFGPYVKWENTYASISKKSGIDFEKITEKEAVSLIKEKQKKDKEKILYEWDNGAVTLQKSRWGEVIRVKGKRKMISVPKNTQGEKISVEELKKLDTKALLKMIAFKK